MTGSKFVSDKSLKAANIEIQRYMEPKFNDANAGIRSVFEEINAADGTAEGLKYTGMYEGGFELPQAKDIGDPTPIVEKVGGYEFEINYTIYDSAYEVSYYDKMSALKQLKKVVEDSPKHAESFEAKIAMECADMFNNGKVIQSPDNVALFSASHPIVADKNFGYGTTFSNLRTSAALDYDEFNDACIEFEDDFLQPHGDKAEQTPSILLIPNVLKREALKIQKAVMNPENNNNEPSVATNLKVVSSGRLDKESTKSNSTWYLLADKKLNPFKLVWRMKPMVQIIDDPMNDCFKVKRKMMFGVGIESPYGCQRNEV